MFPLNAIDIHFIMNVIAYAARMATRSGGFTIAPAPFWTADVMEFAKLPANCIPKTGFVVGISDFGAVVPRDKYTGWDGLSVTKLEKWYQKVKLTLTNAAANQLYLGYWRTDSDHEFDIVQVIPRFDDAISMAKAHNQRAIYDLNADEVVYVNDTLVDASVNQIRDSLANSDGDPLEIIPECIPNYGL